MEKTKIAVTRDVASAEVNRPCMVTDTYELWWDASYEDWLDLFKAILYKQGFHPETIEETFGNH